jgi:hypothetical protein
MLNDVIGGTPALDRELLGSFKDIMALPEVLSDHNQK